MGLSGPTVEVMTETLENTTRDRIKLNRVSPEVYEAVIALNNAAAKDLDADLAELIKIRASQLNGCAFCTDMHSVDARRLGETDRRLYSIVVWRDSNFFNPRERAALAWTEAVTLLSKSHVPDDVYEEARAQFSEGELVDLTIAVTTINSWNRLAVSFRQSPST